MSYLDKEKICHEIALLSAKFELEEFKATEYPPIFSGFEDHQILYIIYHWNYEDLYKNGDRKLKQHQDRINEMKEQRKF